MTSRPRVLLVIAHYFREEIDGKYSSTSGSQKENRRSALERALIAWRTLYGPYRYLHWSRQEFELRPPSVDLDIAVLVNDDNHLIDDGLLAKYQLKLYPVKTENPRLLPFGAHKLMKRYAGRYDWFIYSEDDLLPHDPGMLRKQALFQDRFGIHRVLQPNRYEISSSDRLTKTYVDGDLVPHITRALWSHVREDRPKLSLMTDLGAVHFLRARNPHAGFFMLSRAQVAHWIRRPDFLDIDCSFVSPLESAGSLSLLKTFSLYKSHSPPSFLEIEHQDQKFSSLTFAEYSSEQAAPGKVTGQSGS